MYDSLITSSTSGKLLGILIDILTILPYFVLKLIKNLMCIKKICNIYLWKSVKLKRTSLQQQWMKFFNFLKILSLYLEVVFIYQPETLVTESMINLGAKLCNMVPVNIKFSSLNVFKSKIKYWIPNHCPCRICKTYMGQVGFVN